MTQAGRREDFQERAVPYRGDMFAVAMRLTGNRGNAEDLVQDALLRAYDNFDKFRVGTNLRAWLLRIVTNTFINQYRRRKRERELLRLQAADLTTGQLYGCQRVLDHRSPEGHYLRHVLSRPLVSAVEALPTHYRVVFLLADLMDLTYQEVADHVGVPVGTVMSRLFRARRLLRKRLGRFVVEQGIFDAPAATPALAA